MKLILKAKAGLTAKKVTVTRGGKTFQQTVYVRSGEKKKKDKKLAYDYRNTMGIEMSSNRDKDYFVVTVDGKKREFDNQSDAEKHTNKAYEKKYATLAKKFLKTNPDKITFGTVDKFVDPAGKGGFSTADIEGIVNHAKSLRATKVEEGMFGDKK